MRKAQVLVETIIGVGVVALVLSAIIPLFLVGAKAGSESWKGESARLLAQETMEAAKTAKEENWNNIYHPLGTNNKGEANPYHLTNAGSSWVLALGDEEINLNNLVFNRRLIIENVSRTGINGAGEIESSYNGSRDDPSSQKIIVKVSWPGANGIELVDYFTRHKNSLWQQTDWAGGPGSINWQDPPGNRYFSQTTNFVPGGDIDTSTVGALKLGKIPGGVAHYGNEFVLNSTTTIYRLNNQNYRLSMRFTAQASGNVNQLRIYINAVSRGNQVYYRYGLQGNAGGVPSGSYISSATANFSSTGWQTVNLGSPAAITAGSVYHLVVQYDSGSPPTGNRYIDIRSSLPNNQTIPLSGATDANADTLAYYGAPATWHNRNQQPLYILGFADGTFEGNPYDARASRSLYGTRFEGETFALKDARTVSGVGLYVASSRDPLTQPAADNLYVTLVNLTTGETLVNGEIFVDPLGLTTSFDWVEYSFSGGAKTLAAGQSYRLYFSSPGSGTNRNYLILNISNPDSSPYYDLGWAGTDAQTIRSIDSGTIFTDYRYIDLSYYFLVPGDQYAPNGELISSTLDTGNIFGAGFNRLSWAQVGANPAGTTLKMQLAANNDNATWNWSGPSGMASDWYLLSVGENIWQGLHSNRYLRYKIRLETTDPTVTPVVDWVRVNWAY